jgi:hypothetical protein
MSSMKATAALALLGIVAPPAFSAAEETKGGIMYKGPKCQCCEAHAEHLRQNGFQITVNATHNLAQINRNFGVPKQLEACHVTLIDNYLVAGHVPAETIRRLLTERPSIKGISLPGMPKGSPGMTGEKAAPFTIYEIGAGMKAYAVQ